MNEQGVVLLFGMLAKELGFHVQLVRPGYPDCKAVRSLGDGRYEGIGNQREIAGCLSSRLALVYFRESKREKATRRSAV